ncbi:MAG: hypothetical protein J3Q66DRAFT_360671 [Benniella sp.]|nr:MAG: hypothetical protein J3Q66DRAFT_360671 [Benniella sp.]
MSQPLRAAPLPDHQVSMFECDFLMGIFGTLIFSAKQRAKRRGMPDVGPLYVVLIVAFVMLVVRPLNITKVIPS